MKHLTLNISVFLGSLVFLFLISQIVIAFTSPTVAPPNGNVPPPLQEGINPNVLDITGTAVNERDIVDINALVGFNDLFVKGNSAETVPIFYGASLHRFYTGGTEKLTILNNGNIGIGEPLPSGKLEIREDGVLTATDGNLVIQHPTAGSFSSIVFPSRVNVGNDYGYIAYYDDSDTQGLTYNYWGNTAENSALIIGTQNDPLNAWSDVVVLKPSSATIIDSTLIVATGVSQKVSIGQPFGDIGNIVSAAKLAVNNPPTASKGGSATDAIYAYANNPTGAAISAEQANALGYAGFFSGNVNITGSLTAGSGVDPSSTNEIQNIIINKGLQRDISNNFGIQNCALDQIMKYNSLGQWVCAVDNSGAGGTVTGTGTVNRVAKFTGASAIGDSTISDDGTNIGIGTVGPSTNLHIVGSNFTEAGTGNKYSVFIDPVGGFGTGGIGIGRNSAGAAAFIQTFNNAPLGLLPNGGNVGIGTAAPGAKLDVVGGEIHVGSTYIQQTGINLTGGATLNFQTPTASANWGFNTTGQNLALSSAQPGTFSISSNVGIGTASPAFKLDVAGQINASGGLCLAGDCKPSWAAVGGVGGSGTVNTVPLFTGATTLGNSAITQSGASTILIGGGTGKLTVGTIDPVYEILGKKYATYVADFAGGVKTEVTGVLTITNGSKIIDFDEQKVGSDLWLFWQTSNKNINDITMLLTPGFEGNAWYEKNQNQNQIIIKASQDGEVSFRLTAPRKDAAEWPNEIKE